MPPPLAIKVDASSSTRGRSFPTPFKCSGDFCGFALQLSQADPVHRPGGRRAAAPPPQASAASALSLLFTKEELGALGDSNVNRLVAAMEVAQSTGKSADGGELRILTYKSIALGRGNREHLQKATQASRQLQTGGGGLTSPMKAGQRQQSHLLDSTLSQELRENSRSRVYGEMDGVANYYRQVRVCNDCYAVYALLDLARQLAAGPLTGDTTQQKQQQLKRKQQLIRRQQASMEEKWEERVTQEVREKEVILMRRHHDDSKHKLLAEVAGPSDTEVEVESPSTLPALTNSNSSKPRLQSSIPHSVSMPSLQAPETASPTNMVKTAKSNGQLLTNQPHEQKKLLRNNDTFVGMDNYLRGVTKRIEASTLEPGQLFREEAASKGNSAGPATVLLVSSDAALLDDLHRKIRALPLELEVESMTDGRQALRSAQDFDYDVILIERELAPGDMTGVEFSRLLRQSQLKRRVKANVITATTILCMTSQTTPYDLQLYKDSGMDGCIRKPVSNESLSHTLQAALRSRVSQRPISSTRQRGGEEVHAATLALAKAKDEQQLRQRRRRRRLEASHSLAMPGLAEMDARDDYVHGVFQMDAETAIPFCVLGGARSGLVDRITDPTDANDAFFNLVVVHDLFDTWERLQILLHPLVARYRGRVQVLLWNYPGQAYTTWRRGTLLNNSYHVACLTALLGHVTGASGGERLLRDKPYHLVGIGNGGNIALSFCCSPQPRDGNTRSLVLLNSFSHVDAQLAQFLHDSAKVLACTPESRPDLPVYFHARFLFSATYLARVSTPLALNLYTAVLNPITLEGRQALTLGALAHQDLRSDLKHLRVPLISLCSAQNGLLDAGGHAETILALANLELVDSVGKVLRYRRVKSLKQQHSAGRSKRPSCVVWLPGGHEALQECKQDVLVLLEQLVTGFHELNDVPHGAGRKPQELTSPEKRKSRCEDEQPQHGPSDNQSKKKVKPQRNFEDSFIDRVLSTVKDAVPTNASSKPQQQEETQWRLHQQLADQAALASSSKTQAAVATASEDPRSSTNQNGAANSSKLIALTTWDPTTPAFERLSTNVVYQPGAGSKIYPLLPEVKEYMGWRVRRNQKRLQRMTAMARVIQRSFRAFYARTLTRRLHREKCAVNLQRLWRARVARKRYKGLKREDWAVRLLQRHWRGKMGRTSYKQRMLEYLSALDIQRIARGWLANRGVARRRQQIHQAAVRIQQLMRRYVACRKMFRQRLHRNAATNIQRVFRGLLGRRRFARERDKFLFSKTQSQGLTFGKQLLLEYKLYGTKLQSDVALLAREKSDVEAQAEKLVKEICEFDEGVRLLEAELLALGQAETDSNAPGGVNRTLDETAKWALREQKMRLDREFSQMLAQIAQRREKLGALEETLARVDQERLRKEEELKALERKLVLLLEEQQKELARIREKQETRSQLALDLIPPGSVLTSSGTGIPSVMSPGPGSIFVNSPVAGGPTTLSPTSSGFPSGSGARGAAPSAAQGFTQQQRQEAASLMESTETMMKFGFMSMSMTYFSSMNMVRAMRKIGAHHLTLDSAAAVSQQRWPENSAADMSLKAAGSVGGSFQPSIPPGGFPGQQPLQVAAWSVSDVGRWLDTLALAQYKRAFADATVDGALLLHLTDDDLRNTLGMEHRLHRKKVLTTVEEMRVRERNQMWQLYGDGISGSGAGPAVSEATIMPSASPVRATPVANTNTVTSSPNPVPTSSAAPPPSSNDAPAGGGRVVVPFSEFCSLVRHGKVKQIREVLQDVPERKFDPLTVKTQFAPGTGTIYSDQLEKSVFHVNKGDDNGNSPLLLAAQNNQLKAAQLLLSKGAYPDHQNSHGHTAGHYAMAYSFFDLGAWLLDPDKGGGRDDIPNENGLTAYDGLS